MDIHARNARAPAPVIQLNAASDADGLQHFASTASTHLIYLHADDGNAISLSTAARPLHKRQRDSRQAVRSRLAYLSTHSPVANIWKDLQKHARGAANRDQGMIVDRSTLLRVLDKNRSSPWRHAAGYAGERLDQTIERDFAGFEALLASELKAYAARPEGRQDMLPLKVLGRAWAANCIRHYTRSTDCPDAGQRHQFKMLLQAVPEDALAEAICGYCEKRLAASPKREQLQAVSAALVSEFKSALSSADCTSWSAAGVAGEIRIDAQSFVPMGRPKQAGFGTVQVYADRSAPTTTMAAKFPKNAEMRPRLAQACRTELAGHLLATREPHPNVVGLKGAVRVGQALALLVEDCSGGHLYAVRTRLAAVLGNGDISPARYRGLILTLARDMLAGLDHLHARCGLIHGDVKLTNVFLGVDGYAKVGGFERIAQGPSQAVHIIDLPAEIECLSPEIIRHLSDHADPRDPIFRMPESRHERSQPADLKKVHTAQLSQASDCFAAGIALYELCYGIHPFERSRFNKGADGNPEAIRPQLLAYSSVKPAQERFACLFEEQPIAEPLKADETALQRMIFSLMARDPDYRASAATALLFPLFRDEAVGSVDVRRLLCSLSRSGQ